MCCCPNKPCSVRGPSFTALVSPAVICCLGLGLRESSCSRVRLLPACEMHTPRSELMLTTTKIPLMILLPGVGFSSRADNARGNVYLSMDHYTRTQERQKGLQWLNGSSVQMRLENLDQENAVEGTDRHVVCARRLSSSATERRYNRSAAGGDVSSAPTRHFLIPATLRITHWSLSKLCVLKPVSVLGFTPLFNSSVLRPPQIFPRAISRKCFSRTTKLAKIWGPFTQPFSNKRLNGTRFLPDGKAIVPPISFP